MPKNNSKRELVADHQAILNKLARIDEEIGRIEARLLESNPIEDIRRLVDLAGALRLQREELKAKFAAEM